MHQKWNEEKSYKQMSKTPVDKGPVMRSFDVFLIVNSNEHLNRRVAGNLRHHDAPVI